MKKKNDEYYRAEECISTLNNEENDLQLEADKLFNNWYSSKKEHRKDKWNEYIRKRNAVDNKNAEWTREMKKISNIRTQIENIESVKNEKIIKYNELSKNLRQTISEILGLYISLLEN